MKINVGILLAFILSNSAAAQSNLIFKDQNETFVGTLVQFGPSSNCDSANVQDPLYSCTAIVRRDQYLIEVDVFTGEIRNENFWFHSTDCTGTPHLLIDYKGVRGGVIVYARSGDSPVLGRVDWFPTVATNNFDSALDSSGTCTDLSSQISGVPLTVIDPAEFGIQQLPNEVLPGVTGLGWLPPLVAEVQQSEVIFCNGMENCPIQ